MLDHALEEQDRLDDIRFVRVRDDNVQGFIQGFIVCTAARIELLDETIVVFGIGNSHTGEGHCVTLLVEWDIRQQHIQLAALGQVDPGQFQLAHLIKNADREMSRRSLVGLRQYTGAQAKNQRDRTNKCFHVFLFKKSDFAAKIRVTVYQNQIAFCFFTRLQADCCA